MSRLFLMIKGILAASAVAAGIGSSQSEGKRDTEKLKYWLNYWDVFIRIPDATRIKELLVDLKSDDAAIILFEKDGKTGKPWCERKSGEALTEMWHDGMGISTWKDQSEPWVCFSIINVDKKSK